MAFEELNYESFEDETEDSDDSDYCPSDPTYSPYEEKKQRKGKRKKTTTTRNATQLESKTRGVSRKSRSALSKDKQVCSHNFKKSERSTSRKRTRVELNGDGKALSVKKEAERVPANSENETPHFVKNMRPSNVYRGFWLHLPTKFCRRHLPNRDASICLVDEWGNEYKTTFLLRWRGLSAGWRGFSISHRLLHGDMLVFHLIGPCKLKVKISRINESDVVNAAICLMDMGAEVGKRRRRVENGPKFTLGLVADQSARNNDGRSPDLGEGFEAVNHPQSRRA